MAVAVGGVGIISVRVAAMSFYRRLANLWPESLPYVVRLRVNRWHASADYVMSDWEVGNVHEELAVASGDAGL
jgi:hypothetical protein